MTAPAPAEIVQLLKQLQLLSAIGHAAADGAGVTTQLVERTRRARDLATNLERSATEIEAGITALSNRLAEYRNHISNLKWDEAEAALLTANDAIETMVKAVGSAQQLVERATPAIPAAVEAALDTLEGAVNEAVDGFTEAIDEIAEKLVEAVAENVGELADELLEQALEPAMDVLQEAIDEALDDLVATLTEGAENQAATTELTSSVDTVAQPILPEVQRFAGMLM